jgi:hypothetical protein
MRKAYKRRPEDFKRRVVALVYSDRASLLIEEDRWLKMIKPEEVHKRYYNLVLTVNNPWWAGSGKISIGERISKSVSLASKGVPKSKSHREALRLSHMGHKHTKEQKEKMSVSHTGLIRTEEHKQNLSKSNKGKRPSDLCIQRSIEASKAKIKPPIHGTRYMYCKFACRCDLCREANTTYARERNRK